MSYSTNIFDHLFIIIPLPGNSLIHFILKDLLISGLPIINLFLSHRQMCFLFSRKVLDSNL